jgi:uncharacterized membrane protein
VAATDIEKSNGGGGQQLNPAAGKKRLTYIDAMRGLAVIWMIQTHVVNACLDSAYKNGFFFHFLNLSNGFVAPSFIFCAGAGFWLAAERKGDEYKGLRPAFWIYLRRLLLIFAIGYWLHLPYYSLWRVLTAPPERLMGFYAIDVLQLIAVSSLIALGLFFLLRRLEWLAWACLLAWGGVVFFTPSIWRIDPFSFLPAPLAMLLARQPVSRFPLFPWSAYLFAGVAVTALLRRSHHSQRWAKILIGLASALILLIFYVPGLPTSYVPVTEWWYSSSSHALFRTSGVVLLFAGFSLLEERLPKRLSQFFQSCGQESLYIYVIHLMIVYGSTINSGISYLSGGRIHPLIVVFYLGAVIAFSYYSAILWHETKTRNPALAKRVMAGMIISSLVLFATMP